MPTINTDITIELKDIDLEAENQTISADVEVEVYCGSCGAGLCNTCKAGNTRGRGMGFVEVPACEKCMGIEYDKGYSKATDEKNDRGIGKYTQPLK